MIKIILKYIRRVVQVFLLLFLTSTLFLFLGLKLPVAQSFFGDKVSRVVSEQVNKTISVDQVELTVTGNLILKRVFVPDNANDTLLSFDRLHIDLAFLDLFDHKIHLESLMLEEANVNVFKGNTDSLFNFSYIIGAFGNSEIHEDTIEDEESGRGFEFSVTSIQLLNVKGGYNDFINGDKFNVDLGALNLNFEKFDLLNSKLKISHIGVSNSKWYFEPGAFKEDSVASVLDWLIDVDQVKIENTNGEFKGNGLKVSPQISFLKLTNTAIDLAKMIFLIEELVVNKSQVAAVFPPAVNDSLEVESAEKIVSARLKWDVDVERVIFQSNNFKVSNSSMAGENIEEGDSLAKRLDAVTFNVSGLSASDQGLQMNLNSFSCDVFNQLKINAMSGSVMIDSSHFNVKDHHIKTKNSSIDLTLKTSFPSLFKVMDSPQSIKFDQISVNGEVDLGEVEVLTPLDFVPETIHSLALDVKGSGFMDDFLLDKFEIECENQLVIDLKGKVKGLPDYDSVSYNVSVNKLMANIPAFSDIKINRGNTSMNLPNWIDLNGSVSGFGKIVTTNLKMTSELGALDIKGNIDLNNKSEAYDLAVIADSLALGKILGDEKLFGNTTFDLNVNGSFFDPLKMNANISVDLKSIFFQGHEYKRSSLVASWKNKSVSSIIKMKDKQLDFVITSSGKWQDRNLETSNEIEIKQLRLKALKISERDISITSKINVETKGITLDGFYTSIDIRKGLVSYAKDSYNFGQSKVVLDLKKETTNVSIESPIVLARFDSEFNIKQLPDVVTHQFNHYFNIKQGDKVGKHTDEDFNVSIKVLNEKVFEQLLVPGLDEIKINEVSLVYASENQQLDFIANIPIISYNETVVDSFYCKINSTSQQIEGMLRSSTILSKGVAFEYPSLEFQAANNRIDLDLMFRNELRKQKFGLKGDLQVVNDDYIWHTSENGLMLYYQPWEVSKSNKVVYNKKGEVKLNDVIIKNGAESISVINSDKKEVKINFSNFTIENLTSIFYPKEEAVKGRVNGTIELGLASDYLELESDINIENLAYNNDTIGNVNLRLKNPKKDNYRAKVWVKGENRLYADVHYQSSTDEFTGELDLTKFELSSFKKYTRSSVKDLSGVARGHLDFKGTLSEPNFRGRLSLNDVEFHAIATNTTYYVSKSEVKFNNNELRLENVSIEDVKGNKATATGYMTLNKLYPNKLRFDVEMTDFPVLQTKEQKDKMFFGNVAVTSDFSVRGTYDFPIIESKLKLTAGSMLTVVVPESEFVKEDYSDVVEFVDFSKEDLEKKKEVKTTHSTIKGIQLNTIIEVRPEVTLKLIVDPIAGDYLIVKGNAFLNFELSPDGQMKLVGVYVAKSGHYQMTYYNVIKRKFSITEGSTVTWTGDLIDAQVNIDAVYATKASPLPLVQAQIGESEANALKQSVPVNVVLTVSEQMLSPKLSFDIRMPNYTSGSSSIVKSKLNQMRNSESEMNKQAFSLLVLNRFIPNDQAQNSTSNSLKSTARGSVSQLVTDQFNALAGNYIKSVNVNFNVDSYTDYSTGKAQGRTDLEIELSKAIFHDRLLVTVGSDFNVEGEDREEDVNDIVGNVRAEYLLSEDGVYRIKVYRQNEYAGSIDGNITKTGLSFIFTEEFKSFGKKKKEVKKDKKTKKDIK